MITDPRIRFDPEGTFSVQVHFLYASPAGLASGEGVAPGVLTWKIACVPGLIEFHADRARAFPWARTDDPRAVTCKECRATAEYEKALLALRNAGVRP